MFLADWDDALFLHFMVPADRLQPHCPFPLDLRDGCAWVSLVGFTMRRFRLGCAGRLGERLLRWPGEQRFLNVRTYVRHHGEPGICFLTEWLSCRVSVHSGGPPYAVPFQSGVIAYDHPAGNAAWTGTVRDRRFPGALTWETTRAGGRLDEVDAPCPPGSIDEFLLEHYSAFNRRGPRARAFRIRHEPWQQRRTALRTFDDRLLHQALPWWPAASFAGANRSPGVKNVWIGLPVSVDQRTPGPTHGNGLVDPARGQ